MAMTHKTQIIHLHGLAAGGEAVGRLDDGRAVFVPRGAPDEDVEIQITESAARLARGEIVAIEKPSPQRVDAPCPYYAPQNLSTQLVSTHRCGGCRLQHINALAQREAKRLFLRDALQRIGGLGADVEEKIAPCVASPQAFSYRNKMTFHVLSTQDSSIIGLHEAGSHRTVSISNCLIQSELGNAVLAALHEAASRALFSGEVVQRFIVRTAQQDALLLVETSRATWPHDAEFAQWMRARVPQLVGVLRREEKSASRLLGQGRDWLEENVDGLRLRVRADGFFQVNVPAAELLMRHVAQLAQVERGARVLDVFCGVGLFALALAREGAQVLGIESGHAAVREAKDNARRNGLEAQFIAEDAARALQQLAKRKLSTQESFEAHRADVLVLDPPRAGAASCLPAILKLRPRRIIYVSCDAATLARDARVLSAGGYELQNATPFDLFPQTAHVESVTLFTDKN